MDPEMKYAAYTQISPERDVQNEAFSKGQINFRINLDSMSRWNPYRSYMRMRIQITDENDVMLQKNSKIGPNMFQGDCFWQQMNMSCNGVKISQIDDYYIQIAALKKRTRYEQSRRDTMMKDTNFAQASLRDRISQVREYGFENGDADWRKFGELYDLLGVPILLNEEIRVQGGNLLRIEYRGAGGGAAGGIDLTETLLEIGDHILLTQANNVDEVAKIVDIGADYIDVDQTLTAFASQDIVTAGSNNSIIYFTKKRPSRRVLNYELIFRPCLGFFDIDDFLPGNYQFELTPWKNGQYKRFAIESLTDNPIPAPEANASFNIRVQDLQLYAYTGIAKSPMNGSRRYEFSETRCQAQTITNATLINKCFVVNKNAHMYTMAFQAGIAGDNARYSRAKFRCVNDYQRNLRRYQLRCDGYTLPTPLPDIIINPLTNTDLSTQQYYEELMYTKAAYLNDPESLSEWQERGSFYAYRLPKPINNPSNRLYVSTEFTQPAGVPFSNFLLLIFDTYYTGFTINLDNGIIESTQPDVMVN